jgi:hypothetical protein
VCKKNLRTSPECNFKKEIDDDESNDSIGHWNLPELLMKIVLLTVSLRDKE